MIKKSTTITDTISNDLLNAELTSEMSGVRVGLEGIFIKTSLDKILRAIDHTFSFKDILVSRQKSNMEGITKVENEVPYMDIVDRPINVVYGQKVPCITLAEEIAKTANRLANLEADVIEPTYNLIASIIHSPHLMAGSSGLPATGETEPELMTAPKGSEIKDLLKQFSGNATTMQASKAFRSLREYKEANAIIYGVIELLDKNDYKSVAKSAKRLFKLLGQLTKEIKSNQKFKDTTRAATDELAARILRVGDLLESYAYLNDLLHMWVTATEDTLDKYR